MHPVFHVKDVLALIFIAYFSIADPTEDATYTPANLRLVCSAWNQLFTEPKLMKLASSSFAKSAYVLMKLPNISLEDHAIPVLIVSQRLKTKHFKFLVDILCKCRDLENLSLFNQIEMKRQVVPKDFVIGYLLNEGSICDRFNAYSLFTESYRQFKLIPNVLEYLFGMSSELIDLNRKDGLYNALKYYFDYNELATSEFQWESLLFLTKLLIIEGLHERPFGIARAYISGHIAYSWKNGIVGRSSELISTLMAVKSYKGASVLFDIMLIPMIYAVVTDCRDFFTFILSEGFQFENGSVLDDQESELFDQIRGYVSHDPFCSPTSICQCKGIEIAVGHCRILDQWGFNLVRFHDTVSRAIDQDPERVRILRRWQRAALWEFMFK